VEVVTEGAIDLLALAGSVVADRVVWTRHARAARRFGHHKEGFNPDGSVRVVAVHRSAPPTHPKAVQWTVLGALEMAADDPDGKEVVRAIELLRTAARGWHIARVEEQLGHTWAVWTIAVAVARRPGLRLAPRKQEVRSTSLLPRAPDREVESGPDTLRSAERTSRRRRAA
jgi:hypothetical protein